jgi:hypothetical protein
VITFFTIAKPFEGHIGTIQRNALASWTRVVPGAQVLVLGDESGVAEAAAAIDAEHIPDIPRNEYGTPLLDGAFRIAAERCRNDLLCYVNADILFPPSLADAARRASRLDRPFVIVGECWNARVEAPLDPDATNWPALLRGARKRGADAIDYFVYTRGVFDDVPPFAVGRTVFDNWLVWKARDEGAAVVDATWTVKAIHQDHTYAHAGSLPQLRTSSEAERNRRLAGGGRGRLYSRYDATHRLTSRGLVRNPLAYAHSGETMRRAGAKLAYASGRRQP